MKLWIARVHDGIHNLLPYWKHIVTVHDSTKLCIVTEDILYFTRSLPCRTLNCHGRHTSTAKHYIPNKTYSQEWSYIHTALLQDTAVWRHPFVCTWQWRWNNITFTCAFSQTVACFTCTSIRSKQVYADLATGVYVFIAFIDVCGRWIMLEQVLIDWAIDINCGYFANQCTTL